MNLETLDLKPRALTTQPQCLPNDDTDEYDNRDTMGFIPGEGSALGGSVNLLAAVRPSTNELGGL